MSTITANTLNIHENAQAELYAMFKLEPGSILNGSDWTFTIAVGYYRNFLLRAVDASIVIGSRSEIEAVAPLLNVQFIDRGADRVVYDVYLDRLLVTSLETRVAKLEKLIEQLHNEKGREAARRLGADLSEADAANVRHLQPPYGFQRGAELCVRLKVVAPPNSIPSNALSGPTTIRINMLGLEQRDVR